MKTAGLAVLASSLVLVAGRAAADECRTTSNSNMVPRLVVRHPLHYPHIIDKHTNKHIEWSIGEEADATRGGILGYEDPAILAVGDFVAGAGCDLLWTAQPNEMAAPRLVVTAGFTQADTPGELDGMEVLPLPWQLAGAFDFTGDGLADLFWWNPDTAAAILWASTGPATWQPNDVIGVPFVAPGILPWWYPVAVAQLEPGGPPGILWSRPNGTGALDYYRATWTGQQLHLSRVGNVRDLDMTGWAVVAVSDYDRDGTEDIVRQQRQTRTLEVCFLRGIKLSRCTPTHPDELSDDSSPDWIVVGPR